MKTTDILLGLLLIALSAFAACTGGCSDSDDRFYRPKGVYKDHNEDEYQGQVF